ncbi:MAG: nitroreductase family protein [Paracoccaceae bacterium]
MRPHVLAVPPTRRPDHPVAPHFPARWSPRAFAGTPVTAAEVQVLLEAARWAPSASNNQPWRFVWALRGEPAFDAIASALVAFNQTWADKAGALIVVASKGTVTGSDGIEKPNQWAEFDAGAAWMGLAMQALHSGLVAHAMGGFVPADLARAVGLPADHKLHAVVAIGHQGPAETLPETLRPRETPSDRLKLADIARHGSF